MADTPSLHDSVSAAFDQVSAATPEPPAPAAPAPAAFPPDAKPSLGELGDKGSSADKDAGAPEGSSPNEPPSAGRVRGPDGRFLRKDEQQTPAQGAESPAAATGVTPPAAGEFAEAPQSWPTEKRGEWAKVPAEVRGYLHQREGELQRGFQQIAQRSGIADAVLGEFAPYAETLAAEGATPVTAIRTLLQTVHALRTGGTEYRKAVLLSMAEQYGVDLNQPYNPELARAEGQAATLMTERMYGQTAAQRQEQQQVYNEMMAFANDPANEFFPYVRQIMGDLVGRGVAPDLKTAYDMATKIHPEVSKEVFNRAVAARDAAARKAAVAGMSVAGAPNGAAAPQSPGQMSLRDTLAAQMSNLTS